MLKNTLWIWKNKIKMYQKLGLVISYGLLTDINGRNYSDIELNGILIV